jgi:hypothetical protein
MPRTQFHKKLATLAGGSARTGLSTNALVGRTDELIVRTDEVIGRTDQLLSKVVRLENLIDNSGPRLVARLTTTLDLLDAFLKQGIAAGGGGGGGQRGGKHGAP